MRVWAAITGSAATSMSLSTSLGFYFFVLKIRLDYLCCKWAIQATMTRGCIFFGSHGISKNARAFWFSAAPTIPCYVQSSSSFMSLLWSL
jgi:hypothetical protein